MVKVSFLIVGFSILIGSLFFLSFPYDLIGFLVGFFIIMAGGFTNKEESIKSNLDRDENDG